MKTKFQERRLWQRHLYYFKIGWSMYLWYVFDFLSSFAIIYVFLIGNIPLVRELFPDVLRFSLAAFGAVFLVSDLIGFIHFFKMGTFSAEQDIAVEASPYTTKYLTKVLLPFMQVVYKLGEVAGFHYLENYGLLETMEKCKKIIRESEERWTAKSKR